MNSNIASVTRRLSYKQEQPTFESKRAQVLKFITANPNCTRRQVSENTGMFHSSVTARIKELLNAGALVQTGITQCPMTGKSVATLKAKRKKA